MSNRPPLRADYYPELDGLRAVAVILVLLYHLGLNGVGGGFVGVDVFFVISGYVITQLLCVELQHQGKIDYRRFYLRRARRLLPALLCTLAVSFLVGYILLRPGDFAYFSGSVTHAMLGISNLFFWMRSGYFDTGAALKPALHTWSLSVEAQFYLFWPWLLAILFGPRSLRRFFYLWLIALGALSLALNLAYIADLWNMPHLLGKWISGFKDRQATIFFLTPFRVFEFTIGACAFQARQHRLWPGRVGEVSVLLGLAMIVIAATQFNAQMDFPSYPALLPCLGAALILAYAADATWVGLSLRNRMAVGLGKISYSLYLVHWPVIVFYRYAFPEFWRAHEQIIVTCITIGLSLLLYRLVETPWRKMPKEDAREKNRHFLIGIILLATALALPAMQAYRHQGWPWRFSPIVEELLAATDASLVNFRERAPGCSFTNFKDFDVKACAMPQSGKVNILVLGDSVAGHSWMGLHAHLPEQSYNLMQVTPSNCRPGYHWGSGYCRESNDFIFDWIAHQPIDLTILMSLGPDYQNFHETLRYMKSIHKPVLVVGMPFIFNGRLPDIVTSAARHIHTREDVNVVAHAGLIRDMEAARQRVQAIAVEEGAAYYDMQAPLCTNNDSLENCDFTIDGGLITKDNNHLTPAASTKTFAPLGALLRQQYKR